MVGTEKAPHIGRLSTLRLNIRQTAKRTQTCEARCQQLCNSVQGGFQLQAYTQILGPSPAVSVVLTLEEDFCGKKEEEKNHAALMQNRL